MKTPKYYKYTWAIPEGAWLYDEDMKPLFWCSWDKIKKLYPDIEDRTYRF